MTPEAWLAVILSPYISTLDVISEISALLVNLKITEFSSEVWKPIALVSVVANLKFKSEILDIFVILSFTEILTYSIMSIEKWND